MTQDIFADWKTRRFVISDEFLHGSSVLGTTIILTDFNFWGQQHIADQLTQWCLDNNCRQKGTTVDIPDDQTLTAFALRWS